MTSPTVCPYCHEPHTLSQCPRWRVAGRPAVCAAGPSLAEKSALMGEGGHAAVARSGASLRAQMPQTAEIIDQLREVLSRTVVDAILRSVAKGQAQAYFAEVVEGGAVREWGRAPSGRRAGVVGGELVMRGGPCSR